jgi:acetyl esterase/lipase
MNPNGNYLSVVDLAYRSDTGRYGRGDLFFPASKAANALVLLIHGGSWSSMDKSAMHGLAAFLVQNLNLAVFTINYRLVGQSAAGWWDCVEDCHKALDYILTEHLPFRLPHKLRSAIVIGASAGGHLAMMTGLTCQPDKVQRVVSIAGPSVVPSRREKRLFPPALLHAFFGKDQYSSADVIAASPAFAPSAQLPPLDCIHSVRDTLVHPYHSTAMLRRYRRQGQSANLWLFNGKPPYHGLWHGTDYPRQPVAAVRTILSRILDQRRAPPQHVTRNSPIPR